MLLWLAASLLLAACQPQAAPSGLPTTTPSPSPAPPNATPSPTIVWFPPTPTYTPFATPAVAPTQEMLDDVGDIIFRDDFSSAQDWQLSTTAAGGAAFGKNELTIAISEPRTYVYSLLQQPAFTNFYLEIDASPSFCHDLDEYGVLLRATPELDYYRFALSCDGQVRLDRINGGQASSPQPWTYGSSFLPGAPRTNRLGVWARGSELRFFINGEFQFSVRDPLLASGGVGVFARSTTENTLTVNFSDLVVHELAP